VKSVKKQVCDKVCNTGNFIWDNNEYKEIYKVYQIHANLRFLEQLKLLVTQDIYENQTT